MRADAPPDLSPAGVYVHIPFCSVRCSYCDFPTVAGRDDRMEAYLDALSTEIQSFQREVPASVDTVFFGGGTPSRLSPEQVQRVLGAVRGRFDLAPHTEVTLEGNPESLTTERLDGYRAAGVNRVSVGVQSFDDGVLRRVGRAHSAAGAEEAVRRALSSGIGQVSLDLIAGLPGEDLDAWPESVARAAALSTDHVSVYLLETDKDTPLARAVQAGRARVPGDDLMAEAYARTVESLESAGLSLYEISNFARDGRHSRHNLKYWTDAPYAAFGVGAHGYARGARRANRRDLDGYVADLAVGRDPLASSDPWDAERRLGEALVLGLRLSEGVDLDALGARYEVDLVLRHRAAWERAEDAGIARCEGGRVRLTPQGRIRSNELFVDLI